MEIHAQRRSCVWRFSLASAFGGRGPLSAERRASGPIKEIQIKGNKKIEKDAVLAKIKSKVGDEAKRSTIADDIKAVHSLGYFDDVLGRL